MTTADMEDFIETGLDQALVLDIDLSWVDNKVLDIIAKADLNEATQMVIEIKRTSQISGLSLALVLYHLDKHWSRFEIDDPFKDYIFIQTGYHPHTIDRYIKIGKLLREAAPEKYRDALSSKTINQLSPIANAIAQGHEIENAEWDKLTQAADAVEVREIIREDVKEAEPRSSSLRLWLGKDGTIWAKRGKKSKQLYVGSLDIESDDPDVQKAIERIVSNTGMLRD